MRELFARFSPRFRYFGIICLVFSELCFDFRRAIELKEMNLVIIGLVAIFMYTV